MVTNKRSTRAHHLGPFKYSVNWDSIILLFCNSFYVDGIHWFFIFLLIITLTFSNILDENQHYYWFVLLTIIINNWTDCLLFELFISVNGGNSSYNIKMPTLKYCYYSEWLILFQFYKCAKCIHKLLIIKHHFVFKCLFWMWYLYSYAYSLYLFFGTSPLHNVSVLQWLFLFLFFCFVGSQFLLATDFSMYQNRIIIRLIR